jgi:hypothetical protein
MTKLDERLLESQGKTKVRGMREREQERLQLLTRAAPWEVFEFRAKPATATSAGEEVVVLCEIVNTTSSPLTWHNHSDMGYFMLFGDQEHIVGSSIVDDPAQGTVIAPSASVKFELLFYTERVGAAEVVIVPMQLYSAVLSLRFRSNKFHIVVETADDSALPTFDELIANTME